ncbi:MAG: HEAT repeat domain-containing protein [Acidimicrobiales bacterium]
MPAPRSSGSDTSIESGCGSDEHAATETHRAGVIADRRATALAGHSGDALVARRALSHPAPSVRATGLGALHRLDELTDADLSRALDDPEPLVRRRAVELAASFPSVPIVPALDDPDPSVVEMTAWSLGERTERTSIHRLAALSSRVGGHPDALCREAAVAALGAIGDQASKAAVIAALGDKPAIRRRAALALAALEGPDVDAALERCRSDRDWQVRQVAEDLLDG